LPQIVITLLLVTFSYAIASLMLDLMYFLIYLLVNVFQQFGIVQSSAQALGTTSNSAGLMNQSLFQIAWHLINPAGFAGNSAAAIGTVIDKIINATALGPLVGGISSVLFYVIFAIAIVIALFKLFFQLLMAYVGIIFSTIFSPLILMMNALPGSQAFSKWFKGMLANIIVFPVVAALFLIAASFSGTGEFGTANMGYQNNTPSYNSLTTVQVPFIGGGLPTAALQALIGLGMIMIMPKIVEMIQKMLGVEGGVMGMAGAVLAPVGAAYGASVGNAVGFGKGAATFGAYDAANRYLIPTKTGKHYEGARGTLQDMWRTFNIYKGRSGR
jgi:hypothetical protein